MIARDAVVPLSVVTGLFPEITQEMSTGQNATAVGKPKSTRSVIYADSDKSKKVTISVDQYATSSAAAAAYQVAVQKSRSVAGFKPVDSPNVGPHAFIGTVTQGTERHVGLGALSDTLVIGVTLAGYESTPETTDKLISIANAEENAAGAALATVSQEVRKKIDALVHAQITDRKTPGIAVAISKNRKTVYEKADGVRETASAAPMLITTPQPIGSITKQFTAAAILLLQEQNKLSIDDNLAKYVPEYHHVHEITLRQMLNMVSGISDNDLAIYGDQLTKPITREQMFANLNRQPLMSKPGTQMAYTNTNYNLLALVVERVSHQSYLPFLQEHVFAPLGMSSTSTINHPPPHMATGYFHDKPGQPFENRAELHPDFLFGTGNLVSTTQDLLKWDTALLGHKVLNDASLQTMFTIPGDGKITTTLETDTHFPVMLHVNDGSPTVYAMGWMLPNPDTKWHGGHTFLFESTNALFSDGYNIAIIGNVRDGGYFEPENLAAEIHNILNPALHIAPLTVVTRPAEPPEKLDLE